MNETNTWTATYKDYRRNTERLTAEIDRLTSQTDAASATLNETAESASNMLKIASQLSVEVERAKTAWDNGEAIAKTVAASAIDSATTGTKNAMTALEKELLTAAEEARIAANRVTHSLRHTRLTIICLVVGVIAIAALTSLLTFHLMKSHPAVQTDEQLRQNSTYFLMLWKNAKESERKLIEEIIYRPQR